MWVFRIVLILWCSVSMVVTCVASAGMIGSDSSHKEVEVTVSLDEMLKLADKAVANRRVLGGGAAELDPVVAFWAQVLANAKGKSSQLASAAQERLTRLVGESTDLSTIQLLAEGKGQAMMPDGTSVDWSPGRPSLAPHARADIQIEHGKGEVIAGQPIQMTIRATNEGRGALYQLRATVVSSLTSAAKQFVLFGRIEPGATIARKVSVTTPATLGTGDISVRLEFAEANGYVPQALVSRVHVTQGGRPQLAMGLRVIDDKSGTAVGNGDGVIQRGEAVDLRFEVKNTGDSPAVGTVLVLDVTATEGVDFFGEKRHMLGTLQPGEKREGSVNISVKPTFSGKTVPIIAQLEEKGPFGISRREDLTLTIDEKAQRKIIALDRQVYATQDSALLSGASIDARPLGKVPMGTALRAIGELDEFWQVKFTTETGEPGQAWVRRTNMAFSPPAGLVAAPTPAMVKQFTNAPPIIVFSKPAELRVETSDEEYAIGAVIQDDYGLASVRLLVDDQVVAQNEELGLKVVREPMTGGQANIRLPISQRFRLHAGDNKVVLEAVDIGGEKQRSQVILTRLDTGPANVSLPPAARTPRNEKAFAVVVGVEQYRDLQTPAAFAKNDAVTVRDYLVKAMGYPAENVRLLVNERASLSDIVTAVDETMDAVHTKDSSVFFYFSGHGAPDAAKGDTYLMPFDGNADHLRTSAYPLEILYGKLKALPTDQVFVVLDACFSGQGDRSLFSRKEKAVVRVTPPRRTKGVVLSASKADQTSVVYSEGMHGLFTYYFLKGLRGAADSNKDRTVDITELYAYLKMEVPGAARRVKSDANQTPVLDPIPEHLGPSSEMRLINLSE